MKWGRHKFEQESVSNRPVKKSKHRVRLEEKYRHEGMSQRKAEEAADKRIKTEKVIAAVAGITVAAAAAYIITKHYKNTVDKVIKEGAELQNISVNSNKGVSDAFYASMGNRDNTKYRGLYGQQLKNTYGDAAGIYETKVKTLGSIKVASKKNAAETFKNLAENDSEFSKAVSEHLERIRFGTHKQNALAARAARALKSGKIDSKVYEAFNLSLTEHTHEGAESAAKKFYETLRSKGYDAVQDINDMNYSGYKTKTPMIVFGGARSLAVDRVREVGEEEVRKNFKKACADIVTTEALKRGSIFAGSIGGMLIVSEGLNGQNQNKGSV
jgi:hypothetical protein